MTTAYGACTTKRRRTKREIADVCQAIHDTLEREHPQTLRGLFYQLVSAGVVAKTEGEYHRTVGRLLLHLRRAGLVPYAWIADNTRWMRRPRTYAGLADVMQQTFDNYRRDLWQDQAAYVEVWVEKDALAGVLWDVTEPWAVPLMVTRGFPSETFIYSAATEIAAQSKPAHLYYFGDWDPSGVAVPRKVEDRLRQLAPASEIHFERVAVNPEQIAEWSLPTRPTKASDSRAKHFTGESVEVDAIPTSRLRAIASTCIEQHVDPSVLARTRDVEAAERLSLATLLDRWSEAVA